MDDFIDYKKIAKTIEDGLNAFTDKFNFVIGVNVADYKPTLPPKQKSAAININGLLVPRQAGITPIKGLNDYFVPIELVIAAPEEFANNTDEILDIVNSFIQSVVGGVIAIGEWTAVVNFDVPMIGALDVQGGIGYFVPIVTTAYFSLFKGSVTSNVCTISVNDEQLIYYRLNTQRARNAVPEDVQNSEESAVFISRQSLGFTLDIPYRSTPVCRELANDAYSGSIEKTYKISYYDPEIGEKTYTMVASAISIIYVAGKIAQMGLSFNNTVKQDG